MLYPTRLSGTSNWKPPLLMLVPTVSKTFVFSNCCCLWRDKMFGMLSKCIPLVLVLGMAGVATFAPLTGQDRSARHGTTERIKVHGRSLEGNLEGDSPDRDVSIYLPPTYTDHPNRRYPVLYMLHGFTDTDAKWFGLDAHSWMMPLPAIIDKALEEGATREMIVVMPNAYTRYKGSMYSNSITTGDWERFIAGDLVERIDSHYRTIAGAASRGLAGHSMGGYGAIRIGMKYPDVFSSIYLMSPCCMTPDFLLHQGQPRHPRRSLFAPWMRLRKLDSG